MRNKIKKMVANDFLQSSDSIFLHVNTAQKGGLRLPAHLSEKTEVVLQVGWYMPIPIPDLIIDDTGVSGTLSFRGVKFFCTVPWSCVFAIVGENITMQQIFPESMPEHMKNGVAAKKADERPERVVPESTKIPKPKRELPPYLRVVK